MDTELIAAHRDHRRAHSSGLKGR